MATNWTYPNIVSQHAENGANEVHVSWNNIDIESVINNDKLNILTSENLFRIARSPKSDLTTKTYFLKFKNFNFINVPEIISGIELRLITNRRGRVMDDTIQLIHGDNILGNNKADHEILQNKIYGSATDLWNSNITKNQILDKNFGILLRFKSHNKFPHKDPMFLNSVEMRIY